MAAELLSIIIPGWYPSIDFYKIFSNAILLSIIVVLTLACEINVRVTYNIDRDLDSINWWKICPKSNEAPSYIILSGWSDHI